MKHKFFRIAAILLCFSVLLVLVGCGAKPSPAQNETEQTAKKLFSDKWKEMTSGEAVPAEICVNYNPGEIDISKAHLSDQVHMSEVCGHLCNSETKQKFFDVCKNLNIDKFEAGSAAYISKDASYKYYEITLIFGEEQSKTDGGLRPSCMLTATEELRFLSMTKTAICIFSMAPESITAISHSLKKLMKG